jgi:thiamine pyrophosphate-dependent acetolactate synthase large subunit-like protein
VQQPNTYFATKGLSTMAFALPAAIGVKLALPDKQVVCFIGDGSLLMCLHDLSLCSRLDLPVIIVVFSDEALGLIKVKQQQKGMHPVGIELKNPDFPALMKAFGGKGFRAKTAAEFDQAMEAAVSDGGLCLIEAVLDPETYGDHLKLIRG